MKKVFVIVANRRVSTTSLDEEKWAYGKHDSAVRYKDLTKAWLSKNGFLSAGAAVRQIDRLPWWKNKPCSSRNASVEEFEVPKHELHYEICHPYEIIILDKDGNQVGDIQYCYGTRSQAEKMAERELTIAEMEV